jgi:hypothetical protein
MAGLVADVAGIARRAHTMAAAAIVRTVLSRARANVAEAQTSFGHLEDTNHVPVTTDRIAIASVTVRKPAGYEADVVVMQSGMDPLIDVGITQALMVLRRTFTYEDGTVIESVPRDGLGVPFRDGGSQDAFFGLMPTAVLSRPAMGFRFLPGRERTVRCTVAQEDSPHEAVPLFLGDRSSWRWPRRRRGSSG